MKPAADVSGQNVEKPIIIFLGSRCAAAAFLCLPRFQRTRMVFLLQDAGGKMSDTLFRGGVYGSLSFAFAARCLRRVHSFSFSCRMLNCNGQQAKICEDDFCQARQRTQPGWRLARTITQHDGNQTAKIVCLPLQFSIKERIDEERENACVRRKRTAVCSASSQAVVISPTADKR